MVMRQMRENTKWIMLITALAFVALMVFEWGMDASGMSGAQMSGGEIGSVNGEPVAYEQYNTAYLGLLDQQQAAMQGQPITGSMTRQIEQAAWDQIVMQKLIAQELTERGIRVTDAEVREAARSVPPQEFVSNELFQTDGQFDITKYHQFLASPSVDVELLRQLEAYYRDIIPRSKLYFQVASGVYPTDDELWRMWRDERETATIEYVVFHPDSLVADAAVTVTPQDVQRFYDENREDFLRPARAQVKYVVLDRTPTPEDTAASRERAQSIRERLQGGADFAEVAAIESADSVTEQQGGVLPVRQDGSTVPEFEEAAFSLPVGQVSEPVQTRYGFHLIRVESRTADEAQVRHILVPIERTQANENALLDRADSLDILAEEVKLDEIARRVGLELQETELVPGLSLVPGLGMAEDGEYWTFEEGEIGEVSPVFETPSAFYAFELVNREGERTLTIDEARQTVEAAVRAQKKVERARERVREAVERVRSGQSLAEVAAGYGTEVQQAGPFTRSDFVPALGRLTPVIGTAFGLRTGQTSGVVESNNQLYIVRLVEREDASRAEWEQQKAEQRQQVTQALAQQRWGNFLEALRQNADIEDNRRELLSDGRIAQGS